MKSPMKLSIYGMLLLTTLFHSGSPHVSTTDVSANYPDGWCNGLGSPTRTTGECICKQDCIGPACQREQGLAFYSYSKCPTCICVKRQVNSSNVNKLNTNRQSEEEENDIPDGIITQTKRKSASWKDREEDEDDTSSETVVDDDTPEGTIIRTKRKKSRNDRFYEEDVRDTSEALFVSYMADKWRSVLGACVAVVFFTLVLPLLFLFGGMSNTKGSGHNGSGDRDRKDTVSSSNRLPSISPTTSGTRLSEKPGAKTTIITSSSSSSGASETILHSSQKSTSLSSNASPSIKSSTSQKSSSSKSQKSQNSTT